MTTAIWRRQIAQERPSPALAQSFRSSAASLVRTLSDASLDQLAASYQKPTPARASTDHVAELLIGSLEFGRAAGESLLAYAVAEHRDPFQAIAAEVIQVADRPEDDERIRALLTDLVDRAGFAEAAVMLALFERQRGSDAASRWLATAESLWPPSVAEIGRKLTRVMWLGSYYVALVLAARDDLT